MGLPLPVRVPTDAVPMLVDGVHRTLEKARFWGRLATLGAVLSGGAAVVAAVTGVIDWIVVVPFVLLPYLPIAATTRIDEGLRLIEDQLRDRLAIPDDADAAP